MPPADSVLPRSCRPVSKALMPVIDPGRCEAKGDCVRVCPYDVFEIRKLTTFERSELGTIGRLRSLAHGHERAATPGADDCHACGLCVKACPEKAIKLVARA